MVGAGPGGASTAYGLTRAGLRTLLLEKERIPRYKPCGGGLTTKVRGLLDFDFSSTIEATIREASIGYGAERMRVPVTESWCVMRPQFDALLTERAVKAGAELRDAQPVTQIAFEGSEAVVTTSAGTEKARCVVGADGVNGPVRRALGLSTHTRMGVALEAEVDVPAAALDEWQGCLHLDFGVIPWGYAWIFPKADHLSIGIGNLLRGRHTTDLRSSLSHYVSTEPSLRSSISRLTRGHRVPLGGQTGIYHGSRGVLVGDAAGLVDPFTAEGIYYAIRSGQIAAEEVARALQAGNTDLSAYTRRINDEINKDFRYAWVFGQVFYRIPHLAYRIFRHSAATRSAVTLMAGGALSYRQMLWRVATNLLVPAGKQPAGV